ncbi:MAG: glycosyltransferase family 39 protein [bacterium]|nr:glycosyltransferase family 39 protein [bacterium]
MSLGRQHSSLPAAVAWHLIALAIIIFGWLFAVKQPALEWHETDAVKYGVNTKLGNFLSPSQAGSEANGVLYYLLFHYYLAGGNAKFYALAQKSADLDYYSVQEVSGLPASAVLHFRKFSLGFYFLSAFFIYLTARRLGGRKEAVLTVLFFALNGTLLSLSSYCRFYSANVFFCILASYLLVEACGSDRKIWGVFYILAMIMCILSMSMSIFLLPFHALYWFYKRRTFRQFWPAPLIIAATFAFLWMTDPLALARKGTYSPINAENFLRYIWWLFGIESIMRDSYESVPDWPVVYGSYKVLVIIALVLSVFVSGYAVAELFRKRFLFLRKANEFCSILRAKKLPGHCSADFAVFASMWTGVSFAAVLVYSLLFTNIINKHNMCFICPGASCMLAALISLCSRKVRWIALSFTAVAAPVFMPICVEESLERNMQLAAFLKEHMTKGNIIVNSGRSFMKTLANGGLPPFFVFAPEKEELNSFIEKHFNAEPPRHLWLVCVDAAGEQTQIAKHNYAKLVSVGAVPVFSLKREGIVYYFRLPDQCLDGEYDEQSE